VISASNNSQPGSAFAKNPGKLPIAISTTGWYTFKHRFYNNGGVLAVDMSIYDSSNVLVNSWTLSTPADLIGGIGGNRYGWFDFDEFNPLAFDNATLTNGTQPNITVNADAGGCTAVVSWTPPTATDNCNGTVTVGSNHTPGEAFPTGATLVTYTFTDSCGNFSNISFNVTVSSYNEMIVSVELSPTINTGHLPTSDPQTLNRCISFELFNCPSSVPSPVDQVLTFNKTNLAAPARAMNVMVLVPCGPYSCVTARDKLHTLRRTLSSPDFKIVGTQYVADFINATGGNKQLIGGNLNDDSYIDILDFGVFAGQFNVNYGTGDTTCSTPYPHADISGDGLVFSGDFTFIQINFLKVRDANCCGAANFRQAGPQTSVTIDQLNAMGLSNLAVADLNGDKIVDSKDIALWIKGVRPAK
jgi:hypothetical protein